jgi:hypothetical protein
MMDPSGIQTIIKCANLEWSVFETCVKNHTGYGANHSNRYNTVTESLKQDGGWSMLYYVMKSAYLSGNPVGTFYYRTKNFPVI